MTWMPRGPWGPAFLVAVAVHLVLNGLGATPWDSVTKCFLAPILLGWVVAERGPRLLVAALAACFLGDLFLELDGLFLVGMGAFAVAHGCFVALLVRRGAVAGLRARPWIVVVYVVVAIGLVAWAWGGLDPVLRVAVPVYAALLLATAAGSAVVDRVAGVGGLLFLVSDGIIALGVAGRIDDDATLTGLAIMALYSAAILLLASGLLRRAPAPLPEGRAAT